MAQYRQWLATLPAATQEALRARWGEPEKSSMVLQRGGEAVFVVPRLMLGKIAILPQPPRGEQWDDKEKALYHSPSALPSHYYLAAYLWAREQHKSDALVHFGTHGSQEWLPGKERGLSVFDPGMLAVGNVPVAYPYIADNIGEAQQAKRRGRAVIVSHQTPPFNPAGLHEALTHMHDLLHAWLAQDDGVVKEKIKADLLAAVQKEHIDRDMGLDARTHAQRIPGLCGPAAQPPARTGRNRPAAGPAHPGPGARGAAPPGHRAADAGAPVLGGRRFAGGHTGCRCGRGPDWRLQQPGADRALPVAAAPCDRGPEP